MQNTSFNTVDSIYKLRKNFLIIGLTGRTGAGCTTIANLLKGKFTDLYAPTLAKKQSGLSNDERKYSIVYNYISKNWIPFEFIKASDVLFYFVLLSGYNDFIKSLGEGHEIKSGDVGIIFELSSELEKKFIKYSKIAKEFDSFIVERKSFNLRSDKTKDNIKNDILNEIKKYKSFLFIDIPSFRREIGIEFEQKFKRSMFKEFQFWGNNVRKYGFITENDSNNNDPSTLSRKINQIIKMLRDFNTYKSSPTFIVIDALRNPFEVLYFRERYSSFYLMSVSTDEEIRRNKLYKLNLREDDIKKLDYVECPDKSKEIDDSFFTQDISKCIELSDIFVSHKGEPIEQNKELKAQLIRFLALIMHPGLIPPSPQERVMQIALTAKFNSGCISRQVGAAITDKNFSVKAIGWNTVPQGQTPCTLCNFHDLVSRTDDSGYSEYEKTDSKFREILNQIDNAYNKTKDSFNQKGLSLSFCFKDLYYLVTSKDNQVHTRSLHAEENAFLQLAKYGSQGIEEGKLFTTASPCELCSKKAYQLGIKEIYYIDTYPGISISHVLHNGDFQPKVIHFNGAIGKAYDNLYNPLLPLKDEIAYLTEVNIKKINKSQSDAGKEKLPKAND